MLGGNSLVPFFMESERSLLKMCITLYTLISVWRRVENEKYMRARSPRRSGHGDGDGHTTCA
jgi:hypothetical protein